MKILYCTDGSKISYTALSNLSGWIKSAEIDTISVIDWQFLADEIDFEHSNFKVACANTADSIINHAQKLIEQYKFTNGKRIKECGFAVEGILDTANSSDYDLILMGSNGKKGIQKWLGSVSQEIINNSRISDYIVKNENNKRNILITTDGSECSSDIINDILPDLNLADKEVHICTVNEDPSLLFLEGNIDTNWLNDIKRHQNIYASNSINKISNILKENDINVHKTAILTGNPAQEIIEYTKENQIDLTILGSRNKSKLSRFLTGSESKRIIENTMSDVLLIRCNR